MSRLTGKKTVLPTNLLVVKRGQKDAQAATLFELREVYILLDRMDFGLPRSNGNGGNAVLVEPVCIQSAIGKYIDRLDTEYLHRLGGAFYDRSILTQFEWRVSGRVAEGQLGRLPLVVLHLCLCLHESFLV